MAAQGNALGYRPPATQALKGRPHQSWTHFHPPGSGGTLVMTTGHDGGHL